MGSAITFTVCPHGMDRRQERCLLCGDHDHWFVQIVSGDGSTLTDRLYCTGCGEVRRLAAPTPSPEVE